jgi:D-3-phosphoglycerate dehydrogenase
LYGGVRYLFDANRQMPLEGDTKFKILKKNYAGGSELRGKTMGVIGFGRIGQETAKIALGIGMNVVAHDPFMDKAEVKVLLGNGASVDVSIEMYSFESVLKEADFISLHVPAQDKPVIGHKELSMMRKGAGLINAARGGVVDEEALLDALENGQLSFAGLDTFVNEPTPSMKVLMHPRVSLTPHIGAATQEAQDRIGTELAQQIHAILG